MPREGCGCCRLPCSPSAAFSRPIAGWAMNFAAGTVRCDGANRGAARHQRARRPRAARQHGLIRSPRAVEVYLRVRDRRPQIKAGTYEIPARASAAQACACSSRAR